MRTEPSRLLSPLSRDHGTVLLCAQYGRKAVRASDFDRLKLAERMREAFRTEIGPNLEDEQWTLSPVIGDATLRTEFHQRHRDMRELGEQLCSLKLSVDPGLGLMARIANVFDDYVRWEENSLYPRILEGIERDTVDHLSALMTKIERKRDRQIQKLHKSISFQH